MVKGSKKRLLFLLARVAVTLGTLGYIYTRIDLHDQVHLKSGETLQGKLISSDEREVLIHVRGEPAPRSIPAGEVARRKDGSLAVNPGFTTVFAEANRRLIFFAFLAMVFPPLTAALRWKVLLRTQGVHLSYRRSARLCFIGQFFNNFLLGLTGGDLMKAYLVTRETHLKAKGALSVFVDRVVGMLALAIIASIFVTMNLRNHALRTAAVFVYVFLLAMVLFMLMVASNRFRMLFRVQRLLRLLRLKTLVDELEDALTQYRNSKPAIFAALGLSLVAHSIMVSVNYAVGRALGIETLTLVNYFALIPMIIVISAIPISLAGWGWGETQYTFFFGALGVPGTQAVALSVVMRLYQVGWSLLGAALYLSGANTRNVQPGQLSDRP